MTVLNRRSSYRNFREDQAWGQNFTANRASPQYNGLVAWWPLGVGQHGMVRDVMGRWHMTAFNTPNLARDGQRGIVTLFDDGSSEYLQYAAAVVAAPPFTLCCWFNSDDDTSNQVLISISQNGAAWFQQNYLLRASGAAAGDFLTYWSVDFGGVQAATTTVGYTANTWHHACAIEYGAASRAVLIDAGGKGTNAGNAAPAPNLTNIGYIPSQDYMSGLIADVRIYNRALSDNEVYAIYAPSSRWDLYLPTKRAFFMAQLGVAIRQPRHGFTNFQVPGIV